MISRTLIFFLAVVTATAADSMKWESWDIKVFSHKSPQEVIPLFGALADQHPPAEVRAEAGYQLAKNSELREWLPEFIEHEPVLWENYSQRSETLWVVQHIRAEWAVRLLLQLSLDDRPMKSLEYDYNDPDLEKDLKAMADAGNVVAAIDRRERMGIGVPGKNENLARQKLNNMGLAGAPSFEERSHGGVSVDRWLRQPAQRNRIPEIVRETWGDRAVLNADIGLGPDNKPLAASKGGIVSGTRRLPSGDEIGPQSQDEASSLASTTTRIALGIAAVLLLIAGWLAFGRQRWRR